MSDETGPYDPKRAVHAEQGWRYRSCKRFTLGPLVSEERRREGLWEGQRARDTMAMSKAERRRYEEG